MTNPSRTPKWKANYPWYMQWKRWTKNHRRNVRAAHSLNDDAGLWNNYVRLNRLNRQRGRNEEDMTEEFKPGDRPQVLYFCDGCGESEKGEFYGNEFHKPRRWFIRGDDDGVQLACSRKCIQNISAKTGKTSAVLPI